MGKVIVIGSQKGGGGKTTTTLNFPIGRNATTTNQNNQRKVGTNL